jgi:dihydropyrimidine dehydrogenase (NADP+)
MHEKGMGLALGTYPEKVREACSWVVEASTVPVFAKLTPNVTDITVIAKAAQEGGVAGVTAINTVSGLVGFHTDAKPGRFGVGKRQDVTYGGLCGNAIRPLAFRGVTAIAKAIPGIPIMATGGIDSADVTAQFLYSGASVVQICSAIMNQDFTIIHDLVTGLKSILYMKGRKDLADWRHGMPPLERQHIDPRPKFGPHEEARCAEETKKHAPLIIKPLLDLDPSPEAPKPLMIQDLIGLGLEHVKTYSELNNQEQVVAYVNPEICLNCGKCFLMCNDNGYQAITFDPVTHIPLVMTDKCTGCGLCESVCPALNCIEFRPRDGFKAPTRDKKDL